MPCRGFITVPLGAPATLSGTVRERMERAGWLLLGQGRHLCPAHRRLWRQEQFELHGHILMAVDEFGDGPVAAEEAARWVCWCPDREDCQVFPPETV
jgi:hypothetical protein